MHKRYMGCLIFCMVIAMMSFVLGCETMGQDTQTGAVGGGLLGAVAGGAIGQNMGGHPLAGAAVGATVGALTGGAIGNQIDQKKAAQAQAAAAQQNAAIAAGQEKMGISDVIVLSKAGVTDDVIIDKISKSGSVYNLTVEEIEQLRKEGVSSRVVNYMMATRR